MAARKRMKRRTKEKSKDWSGLPVPSPGYRPDPGIEPGSPALQTDYLPPESAKKPLPPILLQITTESHIRSRIWGEEKSTKVQREEEMSQIIR